MAAAASRRCASSEKPKSVYRRAFGASCAQASKNSQVKLLLTKSAHIHTR